jgi:transposase
MDQTLIEGFVAEFTNAEKAYDAEPVVTKVLEQGSIPVIPPGSNRKTPRGRGKHLYKERHLAECFFCKIERVQAHRHPI